MDFRLKRFFFYSVAGEKCCFLGMVEGINTFSLSVAEEFYLFYLADEKTGGIVSYDKTKVRIFKKNRLPEDPVFLEVPPLKVNETELTSFILFTRPDLPNSAFCPKGMLFEYFEKKGILINKKEDLDLQDKYRALNPAYCIDKNGKLYRQIDLREKYPEIILKMARFDKNVFLDTSAFKNYEEIYLSVKSAEAYGGTHIEFGEWQTKVTGTFADYFKTGTMYEFKRIFHIRQEKLSFFTENKIDTEKIILLKPAV